MQNIKPATAPQVNDFHILYLHGFLSSPQSSKARQTRVKCEQLGLAGQLLIPSMYQGPQQTILQLEQLISSVPKHRLGVIGSSLGGFYATWLAEKYDIPAVLINPAVRPDELLDTYLGEHRNYYSDHMHLVTRKHLSELRGLYRPCIRHSENFLVLLQKGDQVLDYQQAVSRFGRTRCIIHDGGDHSYQNYAAELPNIIAFLQSRIESSER